jgi:hypothetical protein
MIMDTNDYPCECKLKAVLTDGLHSVELNADDLDAIFSAAEDYAEVDSPFLISKLRKTYRLPGSVSMRGDEQRLTPIEGSKLCHAAGSKPSVGH